MGVKKTRRHIRNVQWIHAESITTDGFEMIVETEKEELVFHLDTGDLYCLGNQAWKAFNTTKQKINDELRWTEKALSGELQNG